MIKIKNLIIFLIIFEPSQYLPFIIIQQNFMIQSLPKNGSCIERKKVFVQFPFHSMNHHSAFQWPEDRSSKQKMRIKNRSSFEQEYIRRLYNDKMQRKLNEKFNAPLDSFKIFHNQLSSKREQEALNEEIENFNQSKILQNNPQSLENTNQNKSLQRKYQSAKQINNKPSVDQLHNSPQSYSNQYNINGPIYRKNEVNRSQNFGQKQPGPYQFQEPVSPRYIQNKDPYKEEKAGLYRRPYINRGYVPEILQNYSNLNNSNNLQHPNHRVRNYLPNQQEGLLKQNMKFQRKRPTDNNLSLQTKTNI